MIGIGMGLWNTNVAAMSGGGSSTATFNPADETGVTLSNGNLTAALSGGNPGGVRATRAISGKVYCEFHIDNDASVDAMVGITQGTSTLSGWLYNAAGTHSVIFWNANIYYNSGATAAGIGSTAVNDVIQLAVDRSNNLFWVGRNNTWYGNPSAGTGGFDISAITGAIYPVFQGDASNAVTANFGASAYAYTPPTGFGNL